MEFLNSTLEIATKPTDGNTTFIDAFNWTTTLMAAADVNLTNVTVNINSTVSSNSSLVARSWGYWLPGPVICAFGIVCNIINLCVLSQKELRDSPYTFLMALSISDLMLLTISFIHLVMSKAPHTFTKAFYDAYIFFAVGNIFFNSGVWFIVVLTVERMCFVVRPLTMRSSRKKARICIVVIVLVCGLINIPKFMCYKIVSRKGSFYPSGTEFRHSGIFYKVSWFHAIFINFIPLIILIVANSTLIHALHRAGKQRASLRSNQDAASKKDQTRLTRTLIAIVVLFFVCVTPSAFVDDPIAYTLFGGNKTWSEYLKSPANQMFIYISNLLLFVNSSLNFMLYCAFNRKFRIAMHSFFRKLYNNRHRLQINSTNKHSDWNRVHSDDSNTKTQTTRI